MSETKDETTVEITDTVKFTEEVLTYNILDIVTYPNEILERKAEPVAQEEFNDPGYRQFVIDMIATLKHIPNGIGLAAPQVNVSKQIIVYNFGPDNLWVMVNPKIIESSKEMFKMEEGCISVPGVFESNKRPNSVSVEYQDMEGNHISHEFQGTYAFVVQHEIDHLNGEVFVDKLSALKKLKIRNTIKSLREKAKEEATNDS